MRKAVWLVVAAFSVVSVHQVAAQVSPPIQLSPLVSTNFMSTPALTAIAAGEAGTNVKELGVILNTLETAVSAAQEAIDGLQAVEYQYQALQSLGQGNWQGFVSAVNYEAAAVGQVDQAWQNLPSLDQIQSIEQYTRNNPNYQDVSEQLNALSTNWVNFANVTDATNEMAQNMKRRAALMEEVNSESQGNGGSVVSQLQTSTQELGLIQGDLSDMETVTLATTTYEQGIEDEAQVREQYFKQQVKNYDIGQPTYAGSYGPSDMAAIEGLNIAQQ